MDAREFSAKWKYLQDAQAELEKERAALGRRYAAQASPVQPGDRVQWRGRAYIVARVVVASPDLFELYGVSAGRMGRRDAVEVFVGYTQPAPAGANA